MSVAEFRNERGGSERPPEFERTPPQDVAAEQSVLGGMLLSKDAIADVIEVLKPNDFYRPAHEVIYDVILDLYARGEPADAITVAAELTKRGEIGRVGGAPYLHTLMSSVPTAANAAYYARIVREQAILRRLVEAGTKIVQLGYTGDGDVDDIVDAAQAEVYAVTERRTSEDYLPLSAIMEGTFDELEAISSRGGQMVGVPTGFRDLDELTNGLHPGQMIIVAARPAVGKSTLGLDVARSAAIRNQLATCIFSLEMSRNEITMRLLSAEAKVALHHMRTGTMTDDDWNKLARRMGEVNAAPLFIDDSPNLSMMEIRAKARRLKQRHDLRLIVVDYLQLMQSGRRVESRQLEVSEFSRQLKLLAKELEVPVIAISQLNRGPEQRTDKKPMMSDLRESGCLPASTRILRADTGAEVTLGELMAQGARDVPVWSLDEKLRYVPRRMTHVFPSGRKEVFALTLASGRVLHATANHPLLGYDGWRPLGEFRTGDRIAVPRHVPAPLEPDGSFSDVEVQRLAAERVPQVPREVFSLPYRQVALYLRELWSRGGVATTRSRTPRVHLAAPTRRFADDVTRLLLRFGIHARVHRTCLGTHDEFVTVVVATEEEQQKFFEKVGRPVGEVRPSARVPQPRRLIAPSAGEDAEPVDVWERVRAALAESPGEERGAGSGGHLALPVPAQQQRVAGAARQPLGRVAALLDEADIDMVATNDVFWDSVVSIDSVGEQDVYDATVLGTHNFIADGVAVHNSLEQDADMVILLHREELYERESPRAGEADLIVAKHRNGPTATVTVAFQGHYSRFVDMAQM